MKVSILLRFMLTFGIVGGLVFGSAGRVDLPFVWAFLALLAVRALGMALTIDRDLLKEQLKPGPGGTDRRIRALMMPFFLAHLLIAGLDHGRLHWSHVPATVQLAGLAGLVLCFSVSFWALRVNRFFSPVVRIQTERGHHLVTGGPYRFVRHPHYFAAMSMFLFSGLALGSWWSLVPNAGCTVIMLRRTVIEDRFLRENLSGYPDYVKRVRYRLIPGVW